MSKSTTEIVSYVVIIEREEADLLPHLQAAVDGLEDNTTWQDTDADGDAFTVSPSVKYRLPFAGGNEAAGVYHHLDNGNLQILGYSCPVPDELRDLLNRAHEAALTAINAAA